MSPPPPRRIKLREGGERFSRYKPRAIGGRPPKKLVVWRWTGPDRQNLFYFFIWTDIQSHRHTDAGILIHIQAGENFQCPFWIIFNSLCLLPSLHPWWIIALFVLNWPARYIEEMGGVVFHQNAISSKCYFTKMLFHRMYIYSTCSPNGIFIKKVGFHLWHHSPNIL